MDSEGCKFCERDGELKVKFLPITEMEGSYLYLFRNQYYRGRCCLILKKHFKLLSEADEKEAQLFFKDLYRVTCALKSLFGADSFDIVSFADATPHFHVHIVPKYKGTELWGKPYCNEPVVIKTSTDEELDSLIDMIRRKIGGARLD